MSRFIVTVLSFTLIYLQSHAESKTFYQAEILDRNELYCGPYAYSIAPKYITLEANSESQARLAFKENLCSLVRQGLLEVSESCYNDSIAYSDLTGEVGSAFWHSKGAGSVFMSQVNKIKLVQRTDADTSDYANKWDYKDLKEECQFDDKQGQTH